MFTLRRCAFTGARAGQKFVDFSCRNRLYSSNIVNKKINNNYSIIKTTSIFIIGGLVGAGIVYKANEIIDKKDEKSIIYLDELKTPKYGDLKSINSAIKELTNLLGNDNITTSKMELEIHSKDTSNFVPSEIHERPYCIVYPTTTEQVSEIAKICFNYKIPMIPFSGGTSIEGHFIPTQKDIIVQPGIEWQELNEYLKPYNLFFGPDPGPGAMIGGMCATSCSGTNALKYGTMKENVISLKVVLADGTIIKTKNRPKKSSNGYNLTGLFIGSEGTLGIITEITLKLNTKPENEVITLINFKDLKDATKTVSDIFQKNGIINNINALELMDEKQMTAIHEMGLNDDDDDKNDNSIKFSPHNLLLFKIGGINKSSVNESIKIISKIAEKNNGFNIIIAEDEELKEDIWRIRKTLLWNSLNWAKKIMPNAGILPTDVAVPISKLPEIINDTMIELNKNGLLGTAAGHAGDGNVHILIIYPPEKSKIAKEIINNMCLKAIQLEGTVSGEHGIGIGKRDLLEMELGKDTIATMRKLKLALDPYKLLNPDKIFKINPNDKRD